VKKGRNNGLFWGGLCSDDWWLEYNEGEYAKIMVSDIEILLKNSPGDRKRLERLKNARKLIADSDTTELPEDGRVYDRLHDRIMNAIARSETPIDTDMTDSQGAKSLDFEESDESTSVKYSWPTALWSGLWRRWSSAGIRKSFFGVI
jgi:hypothetical protein